MYSSSGLSTDVFFPNKTNINTNLPLLTQMHNRNRKIEKISMSTRDYYYQYNIHLERIPCKNTASISLREAFYFHQFNLYLRRILSIHPTSISECINLIMWLFCLSLFFLSFFILYPHLNIT